MTTDGIKPKLNKIQEMKNMFKKTVVKRKNKRNHQIETAQVKVQFYYLLRYSAVSKSEIT